MTVTDYASAEAFLVNARTKMPVPRKKIANNTYVERGGHITERGDQIKPGEIGIVLHETAVVVYGRGYIRLNAGGWFTMTTCDRINTFTPHTLRVWSDAGRWMVLYGPTDGDEPYWERPSTPFHDGMAFIHASRYTGAMTGDYYLPQEHRDIADEDAHNAMVKRLVARYLKAIKKGTMGEPGGVITTFDSCTLCCWTDVPTMTGPYCTTAIIPSIGDRMGDTQHLIDHMLEGELPHALELHACREVAGDIERAHIWSSLDDRRNECLRKFLLTRLLVGAVATKHGRRPIVFDSPVTTPEPVAMAGTEPY